MKKQHKLISDGTWAIDGRQPMLTIVVGETGVGKTYRNRQEVRRYLKDDLERRKKGRKALAFDTNDDDYTGFKTVSPDSLRKLVARRPRRIRPFNANGSPMSNNDKKEVVRKILSHFQDGLILLDDIDDYMTGEKGQDMISALCTLRHKGVDIIFTHQSISKITTTAWQNCTWLRMHHQVDDVHKIKTRIPKYPMVRIAQLIVDEQYDLAYDKHSRGEIDKEAFKKRSSFFLYVNMRKQKLRGCSRAAYIRACKKFIDQEASRKITMMLNERDMKNQPIYKDRGAAMIRLIGEYLRYHESDSTRSVFEK